MTLEEFYLAFSGPYHGDLNATSSISLMPDKSAGLATPFLFPQGSASLALVGRGSTDGTLGTQSAPQPQAGPMPPLMPMPHTPQSGIISSFHAMISNARQPLETGTEGSRLIEEARNGKDAMHLMTAPTSRRTVLPASDNLAGNRGTPNKVEEQLIVAPDGPKAPKNTKSV